MKDLIPANPEFQVLHFGEDGTIYSQDVIAWKCEDSGVYPVTICGVWRCDYVVQPCGSVYHHASGWFDTANAACVHWLRSNRTKENNDGR